MKFLFLFLFSISLLTANAASRYWVSGIASNWNNTLNWSTTSGGAGGASVPVAGDFVYFNASGSGNCTLDINADFDGINTTNYTSTIDLNGFVLNPSVSVGASNCIFGDGTIMDGTGTQTLNYTTNGYTRFINTTFNLPLIISANGLDFKGGVYNNPVDVTLTGNLNYNGSGGCTFNSTFKATTTSSNYFLMGYTNPDIFNGEVTLINNGTSRIRIAYNSIGNQFNDNVIVGSTAGSGVWFSEGTNGTANLANTKIVSIDAGGFTTGDLRFKNFTQNGVTGQNLSLSGTAVLRIQVGCSFDATVNFDAPQIYIDGSTFNSASTIEKTGVGTNNSNGNNTFVGNCIINNSGSGYITMGNTNADDFQGNLTINNTGTSRIYIANNSIGNTIGGNLNVNNPSTGSSAHVIIANASTSEITITGNVTINNNSSATSSSTYLGNNGDATVNGTSSFLNNTTGDNGHIYVAYGPNSTVNLNGNTSIDNNGAGVTKRYYFGNGGNVVCNGLLTISNNSTASNSQIYLNRLSTSTNLYNENIIVESTTASSDGILFGESGGAGTLAATKTVTIGAAGYISGYLKFRNFTQIGNTAQSLTCSGTSFIYNYDSNWGGDISFISPRMITRGTTYNRTSYIEKNGSTNDASAGGNTFMMNSEIKNSGSGYILMANTNPDVFQGDLLVNNIGSSRIFIANNSAGNTVAGNVTANNSGTGTYSAVYFAYQTSSDFTVTGTTSLNNSGTATTSLIFLGYSGDVTLNGMLNLSNTSASNSAYISCNNAINSNGVYNGNITVENTNIGGNGIYFGASGGTETLAATKTITIAGGGFVDGKLYFRNFNQIGNTAQNLTCTGTAFMYNYDSNWGGDVSFIAPRMITRGTTYNRTSYLEKTGAINDYSNGDNIFVLNSELRNSGSNAFVMGNVNPDIFQADLLLNNTGTYSLYVAYSSLGNTIAGNLTANNTGTGTSTAINIANQSTSDITITGTTVINNLGSSTSSFFYLGNQGDVTLNNDLTVVNNATGTNANFNIANGTSSSLIVNGNTSILNAGVGTSRRTYLGAQGDVTLNGTLAISNSSSATNSQVYCNNSATSIGVYNDNITVESTNASCDGVYFGGGNGSATLAATKTVTVGAGGFVSGYLQFRNFTQVGNTAQNITCTGTALFYNYDSNWGGDVIFTAPRMLTRGTTYNRTSYIEKTGAGDDYSIGNNIFMMNSELKNTSSGTLTMGNGNPDDFQADLLINNLGTKHIYMCYNSAGNTIDGILTVNNIGTANNTYVNFANNVASTLTIAGATQLNNLSSSINSNIYFPYSGDIVLNNNLNAINNTTSTNGYLITANGNDASLIVNGNSIITNAGGNTTKRIYIGNQGDVTFNGTLDITNSSSATNSQIYANYGVNSLGLYNDNITVESTNASSDGVLFGFGNGNGTLAANKIITINGGGFIAGNLYFRNFTQLSNTAQVLQPTGTTRFENYNSTWNGNVDFRSPTHFTRLTTYNGTSFLEKNGTGNDASLGGNVFNGNAILKVTNSGYFMPSNGVSNDFNANASYIKTGSGRMYPGYNCTNTYAGDVTIESNSTIRFGAAANGRTLFDGTIAQNINKIGATPITEFRDIETQNPNAEITLNTPIIVLKELDLQQGNLISTITNLIYSNDNSIVSNVSDNAFIDGPIEKIGNDTYIFPVGKTGVYRPIEISAPASGGARFRGEFFPNDVVDNGIPDLPVEAGVHHVSDCEYWILDRIASSNAVNVKLSYKNYSANNCSGVLDPSDLVVARWDGGIWKNHGNGGTTGTATSGTVITSAPVTSFSPFTLASLIGLNPLPIELVDFTATNNQDEVDLYWQTASETDNDFFTVERSQDASHFTSILTRDGAGNSAEMLSYFDVDKSPLSGVSYYRLKQTDFDGKTSYSGVIKVNRMTNSSDEISVYPNPVNDIVNVSISETDFTINIYSIDGKLIKSVVNKKSIDMNDFEAGIYQFVVLSANNYVLKTIKVVKL